MRRRWDDPSKPRSKRTQLFLEKSMNAANHTAIVTFVLAFQLLCAPADGQQVKETAFSAPHNVSVKVRMEGPYTADVPLQIVCYFKYTSGGAKRMSGAPVELDKEL